MKNTLFLAFSFLLTLGLIASDTGISYIQYMESEADIRPAATGETIPARLNIPVYPGDLIDTRSRGRMIIALSDSSLTFIGRSSEVEMRALAYTEGHPDRRTYLYVREGILALDVPREPFIGEEPVIGCAFADVYVNQAGAMRLDFGIRRAEVKVYSGQIEIATARGSALVSSGELAYVYEDGYIDRMTLRSNHLDDFDLWVKQIRDHRMNSESGGYVGESLNSYSYVLDDHGSWVYLDDYSTYAWRPTVEVDWRPYARGHWRYDPSGYFWVGYEPWSYVTYHYGRWVWTPHYGWIWVPGYTWSGSWVYWWYGPGWIGWCPIGYWDWWWWGYDPWYWRPPHCWDCYHHVSGHVAARLMDNKHLIITGAGDLFASNLGDRIYTPDRVVDYRINNAIVSSKGVPLSKSEIRKPDSIYHKALRTIDSREDLTSLMKASSIRKLDEDSKRILQKSFVSSKGEKDLKNRMDTPSLTDRNSVSGKSGKMTTNSETVRRDKADTLTTPEHKQVPADIKIRQEESAGKRPADTGSNPSLSSSAHKKTGPTTSSSSPPAKKKTSDQSSARSSYDRTPVYSNERSVSPESARNQPRYIPSSSDNNRVHSGSYSSSNPTTRVPVYGSDTANSSSGRIPDNSGTAHTGYSINRTPVYSSRGLSQSQSSTGNRTSVYSSNSSGNSLTVGKTIPSYQTPSRSQSSIYSRKPISSDNSLKGVVRSVTQGNQTNSSRGTSSNYKPSTSTRSSGNKSSYSSGKSSGSSGSKSSSSAGKSHGKSSRK